MSTPEVSVLLPARNCGDLLITAVESILGQTLKNLELIVIDDASDDDSIEKLPQDPRVRVITNSGKGLVSALNHGASVARARYLARMDGDDIALPQRLERQIELLETNPDLGIVGAQVEIFSDSGLLGEGYRHYQKWLNDLTQADEIRREIFIESPIPHPTAVIRKAIFDQLGGYREISWAEDYDLWLRAFVAGVAIAKPNGILLRWRDHVGRLSRNDSAYSLSAFTRAKAHFLARTVLQNQTFLIWGAGSSGTALYDALEKEGKTAQAFLEVDVNKIGKRKRGKSILTWQAIANAEFARTIILGAVGSKGARAKIRAALLAMGKSEGLDFWFTA